jgi:O-antigen/teichoic acid export membrane protein
VKIIIHWLKTNSAILANAGSLVGTTAITSVLGFVYWWIAAKWFSPDALGVASASVSAVMLLAEGSMLGLGTLLITELRRQPEQAGSMISTALIVVGVIGAVMGALFALIASHFSLGFRPLGASLIDIGTFSAGVAFYAIGLVLDLALIGLLKGSLQFWRNTCFVLIKLVALLATAFWPSSQPGMKIYATWMVSSGLSIAIISLNVAIKPAWRHKNYLPQWGLLRKLGPAAIQHHLLNLTLLAPTLLLPVLVTILLSARMNAWFYVAWMLVSFVFVVPGALSIVLHAINSAQQTLLARKARSTISLALAACIAANLVLQLGTSQVLGLFGKSYAQEAAWCLRILALGAFPLIIKNHYISICRIQDRIVKAMIGMLPGGVLEIGAAALGAYVAGLSGLSLGWVGALCIEAAFMLPTVFTVVRNVQPASPQTEAAINQQWEIDKHDTTTKMMLK